MFQKRLSDEGIRQDERYSSNANPFHATGTYAMPNCTCYAYGRVWEINGVEPKGLCLKNAKYWFNESTGFEKGTEPRLGAIMCFDGTAGHVAVVEEVKENGDVVISQSNFGGEFFFTKTLKKSANYNNYFTNVKFMGFLYTYTGEDAMPNFNKPVPEQVKSTQKLVLPGSAESWRVYPTNVAPKVGNECGKLKPSKFGGLTYDVLGYSMDNVAIIQTRDFGQVQIYVAPNTGAIIQ